MQGNWEGSSTWSWILDPLNGEPFIKILHVQEEGLKVGISHMHDVHIFFSNIFFLGYTNDALER